MAKAKVGRVRAYVDGRWQDDSPLVLGPHSHAVWLSSVVFDGARAFRGVAPDLDRHCARVVASARILGLAPTLDGAAITALAWQGIRHFPEDAELYICPMFYAEDGFIMPDPDSTRFVLTVYESTLPAADGFSACLSSYRRPAPDMAPTGAKASCLYPNVARSVSEAEEKGFGNVAEFAYANLFMVREGVVLTPAPNGTFLDGITRQRVTALLREAGLTVRERTIAFEDLLDADELFGTGNYYKVAPCVRLEDRDLEAGPVYRKARELYFAFARRG
ncbi:MAG: branched-chain amino acid aminotransferase [Proteobacteria bacterium]|nr:branched-chain amino acid aminotransferase [Pseudomonadota bacterium]